MFVFRTRETKVVLKVKVKALYWPLVVASVTRLVSMEVDGAPWGDLTTAPTERYFLSERCL